MLNQYKMGARQRATLSGGRKGVLCVETLLQQCVKAATVRSFAVHSTLCMDMYRPSDGASLPRGELCVDDRLHVAQRLHRHALWLK